MYLINMNHDKNYNSIAFANTLDRYYSNLNVSYRYMNKIEVCKFEDTNLYNNIIKINNFNNIHFINEIYSKEIYYTKEERNIEKKTLMYIEENNKFNDEFITILLDNNRVCFSTISLLSDTMEFLKENNCSHGIISYSAKDSISMFQNSDSDCSINQNVFSLVDDELVYNKLNNYRRISYEFNENNIYLLNDFSISNEIDKPNSIVEQIKSNFYNSLIKIFDKEKIISKEELELDNYIDSFDNLKEVSLEM